MFTAMVREIYVSLIPIPTSKFVNSTTTNRFSFALFLGFCLHGNDKVGNVFFLDWYKTISLGAPTETCKMAGNLCTMLTSVAAPTLVTLKIKAGLGVSVQAAGAPICSVGSVKAGAYNTLCDTQVKASLTAAIDANYFDPAGQAALEGQVPKVL